LIISSRRQIQKILNKFHFSLNKAILLFLLSFLIALSVAFIPEYKAMNEASNWTLFILMFAAMLWVTEAIPAFAVSIFLIGLEIVILGHEDGVFAKGPNDWKMFLEPWASSLIFLFIGGFILSIASSKTQLDTWIAKRVLHISGTKPTNILTGIMAVTFIFSMFISNTATTTMMLAVALPIVASLKKDNPFAKALLIGIAAAANIGGMGTIIGTPPNAIAVGTLGDNAPSFLGWMMYAVPPALIIIVIVRFLLLKIYPSSQENIDDNFMKEIDNSHKTTKGKEIPFWHKKVVIVIFIITISLWLTNSIHGLPITVVAFLPIVVFTLTGIIDEKDIRSLPWDILILITGGLSLGLAVSKTGLASWLASSIPLANFDLLVVIVLFAFMVVIISNFMSNTAATNILLPMVTAIVIGFNADNILLTNAIIIVALSASNAMMLSVSTPPNAIVYSSGLIRSKDFLILGLFVGIVGPMFVITWIWMVL
jgi:sodium-dependent dicarboxylate transporter 2/3/5